MYAHDSGKIFIFLRGRETGFLSPAIKNPMIFSDQIDKIYISDYCVRFRSVSREARGAIFPAVERALRVPKAPRIATKMPGVDKDSTEESPRFYGTCSHREYPCASPRTNGFTWTTRIRFMLLRAEHRS